MGAGLGVWHCSKCARIAPEHYPNASSIRVAKPSKLKKNNIINKIDNISFTNLQVNICVI